MSTYSTTDSLTFTVAHARQLASKIAAELYQCHLHYGQPGRDHLADYQEELVQLLKGKYLAKYEFGFKRDGARIVCWRYTVRSDGSIEGGDAAGGVYARADVTGAEYYNFVTHSDTWHGLDATERAEVRRRLPFTRGNGSLPSDGRGHWVDDRAYIAGGIRVARRTFRPW